MKMIKFPMMIILMGKILWRRRVVDKFAEFKEQIADRFPDLKVQKIEKRIKDLNKKIKLMI